MIPLITLWLPILLSAVIVYSASVVMHMVLAYHKSDYRKLPDEERVTDALRSAGVTRGPAYFFPYFSFKGVCDRENETRTGGFADCTPQRPTFDGKEYDPMVFVLCGDQHFCCLPVRPFAGARDRFFAGVPCYWYRRFLRIRRSPRPGIHLERPKLGRHAQASFR